MVFLAIALISTSATLWAISVLFTSTQSHLAPDALLFTGIPSGVAAWLIYFRGFRPGAKQMVVDAEGVLLQFPSGSERILSWKGAGIKRDVIIWDFRASSGVQIQPRDEISMLTPDRRAILITPEALGVIMSESNAHGLKTESMLEPTDHPATWRRFRIRQP